MKEFSPSVQKAKLALLAMQRHSWEQGVAMQAFYEMGDMETVVALSQEAAYRALPDGRAAVIGGATAATDPCSTGEAMDAAAKATGDPALKAAYERLVHWAAFGAPSNPAGVVYHFTDRTEFWADSMYMLPPLLAHAGHYDAAMRQINGYWDALYRPDCGLMGHMWDDATQKFVRKAAWGTGTGWTLAGFARVIAALPAEYAAEKKSLIDRATALLEAVLPLGENGMFRDVLDDPTSFLEVNLSQMVAYTIYRGVRDGWLSDTLLPRADELRAAANRKLDRFGLVRDVCGAPAFDRPGVSPEGQAFYLLMEAAAEADRKSVV